MLGHIINLLVRSFMAIPASLGSNWLGIVFPILVVIAGEAIAGFFFGWSMVITNWKKATGIGFAALGVMYTLLFMWCVVTTTYGDHVGANVRIGVLRHIVDSDLDREERHVYNVRKELDEKLNDLGETCAELKGANKELDRRTGDQQSTINNCQTSAIRLLTPVLLQITPIMINPAIPDQDGKVLGDKHVALFVLTTNKTVEDVKLVVTCNHPIYGGNALPMRYGSMTNQPISSIQANGSLLVGYDSPSFTISNPVVVRVGYTGDLNDFSCEFAPLGSAK